MVGKLAWIVVLVCTSAVYAKSGAADPKPGPGDAKPGAGDVVPADEPALNPGQETKIDNAQMGGKGKYIIYVPKNYTPDHDWPIIFCYHGVNNEPKVWPFKELTGGENFIIVGMEYSKVALGGPSTEKDLPIMTAVAAYVSKRLKVNTKLMFIGGFSQGGWETSHLGEAALDTWAGLIITGAGRASSVPDAQLVSKGIKGKAVFIGVGEKCPNNQAGHAAAESYKKLGADVTFEEFAGMGHDVDTKDAKLKQWLLDHGPLLQVHQAIDAAQAAEKGGKLGDAYTLYHGAAAMASAGDLGVQAQKSAAAIEEDAKKKLSDAEAAMTAKKYADAGKLFTQISTAYAGSTFGETAAKRLNDLRQDPTIKAEIAQAQIDAKADILEAAALAAEKAKDYAKAIAFYEHYVAEFAQSHRFAEVKAHLEQMKADKTIMAGAHQGEADVECKNWLNMANSYVGTSMPEKAKPYLQKIIDKYPTTDWAGKAKKLLAEIGN